MDFKRKLLGYNQKQVQRIIKRKLHDVNMEMEKEDRIIALLDHETKYLETQYKIIQGKLNEAEQRNKLLESLYETITIILNYCESEVKNQSNIIMNLSDNIVREYIKKTLNININKQDKNETQILNNNNNKIDLLDLASYNKTKFHAMVIDDDKTILAMLKAVFEREGAIITEVADGNTAALLIDNEEPPDIVILDIMLPYLDGMQILQKIRKNDKWHQVPVVMISAKTSEQEIVKFLEAGANDYIKKPFNIKELLTRVKKNL